jgi:hypothetical protein
MLLALTTAQRCQTLAAINISDIKFLDDTVVIQIRELLKQSEPGVALPRFILPACKDKNLSNCVVLTLASYLHKTKAVRPEHCEKLFISFVKPHGEVTRSTISYPSGSRQLWHLLALTPLYFLPTVLVQLLSAKHSVRAGADKLFAKTVMS